MWNTLVGFPCMLFPAFSSPAVWCRIFQSCVFSPLPTPLPAVTPGHVIKKVGDHAIRSVVENLCSTHTPPLCMLIDTELLATKFLHCAEADLSWHAGIRCVWICCGPFSVLWPWPWPNDLHIRSWPLLPGDTLNLQRWTSYVKSFEIHHLTDRHNGQKL